MKKFFTLLLCLCFGFVFSQDTCFFDYALVYDISFSNKKFDKIYYVNSNNNNFYADLTYYKDSTNLNFNLIDRKKEILSKSKANQELFFKAEVIKINCSSLLKSSNPYKYKTNEYNFVNFKDTLINDTLYYHYAIKSNKGLKYIKRKKIAEYHYIVTKDSPNFLPLLEHPTSYEEWKVERNIPNGVMKSFYMVNSKGELTYKAELKSFLNQTKKMVIPDDCTIETKMTFKVN